MCKVFCEIFLNMFVIFMKYFHNFPRASFVRFSHLFFFCIYRAYYLCLVLLKLPHWITMFYIQNTPTIWRVLSVPALPNRNASESPFPSMYRVGEEGRERAREILFPRKRVAITEAVDGLLWNSKILQKYLFQLCLIYLDA